MGRINWALVFGVGFSFALGNCKLAQPAQTSLDAVETVTAADAADLGASDLSILVPLQLNTYKQPAGTTFGKRGTGMCNAPELDLGGDDPVMTPAQWQDWAKDVLLSVLPLPSDPAGYSEGKVLAPNALASLTQTMGGLADVESELECPDAVGLGPITDDQDALRRIGGNVVAVSHPASGACSYRHWHIVSARFEPCSYRAKVLTDDPTSLNAERAASTLAQSCGGAEFRIVAQPFTLDPDTGSYTSVDMALHLFYKLDNVPALLADMSRLRHATRAALAGKTADGADGVWYADQKDLLIPHPGLREEMDCGGNLDGNYSAASIGPVGLQWRRILTTYAKSSHLFKVAWLTSDQSGGNWTFGLRLVLPNGGSRIVQRIEEFKNETFTTTNTPGIFPYSPFDPKLSSVDYFYQNATQADAALTSPAAVSAVKELIDLANPDHTSFNMGGKLGGSCAACHTRDQTERAVSARSGQTHAQLAQMAATATWSVPMWKPFNDAILQRNSNNVHNFSYGAGMVFGVSRRAINESEALRRLVRDNFGSGSVTPASLAAAATAPTTPAVTSATLNYETDILPVLTTRCGYCHSIKRSPFLLQMTRQDQKKYAPNINYLTHSDVLKEVHMPPGKVLPKAELDLLKSWANSFKN